MADSTKQTEHTLLAEKAAYGAVQLGRAMQQLISRFPPGAGRPKDVQSIIAALGASQSVLSECSRWIRIHGTDTARLDALDVALVTETLPKIQRNRNFRGMADRLMEKSNDAGEEEE